MHHLIAIDGPAASGKSSVARAVARRLNFSYVNSGALYRAVTWHLLQSGVDLDDVHAIKRAIHSMKIDCQFVGDELRVRIDGVDPTAQLREPAVNQAVSRVSAVPRVRELLGLQMRQAAAGRNVVMEGRDIGSVVFRDTPFKFYIDASPHVRVQRRLAEGVCDEITLRDRVDSSRSTAPLMVAPDAELIDSSRLTVDQVVDAILARLHNKNLHGVAHPRRVDQ